MDRKICRFVIIQGRNGWYWRLMAANNKILAVGGEPFGTRRDCLMSVNRFKAAAAKAELVLPENQ